jgi:hypothetical protein
MPEVKHDLEELCELHDLIELGPHWDRIARIEVLRSHPHVPNPVMLPPSKAGDSYAGRKQRAV